MNFVSKVIKMSYHGFVEVTGQTSMSSDPKNEEKEKEALQEIELNRHVSTEERMNGYDTPNGRVDKNDERFRGRGRGDVGLPLPAPTCQYIGLSEGEI